SEEGFCCVVTVLSSNTSRRPGHSRAAPPQLCILVSGSALLELDGHNAPLIRRLDVEHDRLAAEALRLLDALGNIVRASNRFAADLQDDVTRLDALLSRIRVGIHFAYGYSLLAAARGAEGQAQLRKLGVAGEFICRLALLESRD